MKPKILHIGLCVTSDPTHGLKVAFQNQSSEYREVNCGDIALNRIVVDMTKDFRPDIVFMQIQEAGKIHENTIKHLTDLGAFVINWNGDVRDVTPPWMLALAPLVSSTMFTNMRDVRTVRQYGHKSDWLEIWVDTAIFTNDGQKSDNIKPVVYFGNNTHSFPLSALRNTMCAVLKARQPELFGSYGSHPGSDGNFNHSQKEEAKAYRGTKIAINVSHYEIERYSSDRLLRILACGTPICLAKRYPKIEDIFVDGIHLKMWDTLEELQTLIDYYMNPSNEEERWYIANNGMEYAKKMFGCEQFVKNVIQYAEDNKVL